MSRYYLGLEFLVFRDDDSGQPLPRDVFEEHLDAVLEALSDLDGVRDADYVATLTTGEVCFTLVVEAESAPLAHAHADAAVRTAVHTCNGATRGWGTFRHVETSTREADLADA